MGSVSVDILKDVVLEWESYNFGCRFGLGLGLGFELNSVALRMATDLNAGIVVLNPSHFPTGGTVDLFDDHEHPRRLEWNRYVRYLLSVDLNISTAEVGVRGGGGEHACLDARDHAGFHLTRHGSFSFRRYV